ncbi:MAG TPA: hypothetical protein PK450_05395 [Paracoccaceae bacterium]|nr:hypothetical protein [Paracoccaceae bacterium]
MLFTAIPVFVARLGFHFLPSAEWVAQSHWGATVLGWAMLAVGIPLMLVGAKRQNPDGLGFKWMLITPFGALLLYWIGYVSVTVGVPLATHIASGKPVQLTYVIENLDRRSDGKCRRPIELKGLPLGFDKLCGFPQSVRDRLRKGESVTVTGQGTRLGLFPEEIVLAQ